MPLSLSRYHSAAMQKQIAAILRESQFDSIVCDFLSPAPNFEHLENCVLFQHNVETMIWRRHAENAPDPLRKLYFKVQADRMFRWERRMCREAAEVIAVSPQDAGLMRDMFEVTRVTAIPTGVDIDFFRRPPEVQPKADLVFLGSMDWLPNIDGIEYFVREILPLIRKRMPTCRLAVVGRTPSSIDTGIGGARFANPGYRHGGRCPAVALGFESVYCASAHRGRDSVEDLRVHGCRHAHGFYQHRSGRFGRKSSCQHPAGRHTSGVREPVY